MFSDSLINSVVNNDVSLWVLVTIVTITVIKSHKEILQTFTDFKANKFKKLENAIACEWVSEDKKEILKAELEQLHIAEASGIKCSVELRNELLDVYRRSIRGIRLAHFQRAAGLTKIENGNLTSGVSTLEKYWYYIELVTATCLWVLTIPVICFSIYATLYHGMEFPASIFLFLPVAGILAYDGAKIISLNHVLTEYRSLQKQTMSKDMKTVDLDF